MTLIVKHDMMKSLLNHTIVIAEVDPATSCEFTIVSLDGKRWRWEAGAGAAGGGGGAGGAGSPAAAAERDAWVAAVEAQILASLQGRVSYTRSHRVIYSMNEIIYRIYTFVTATEY